MRDAVRPTLLVNVVGGALVLGSYAALLPRLDAEQTRRAWTGMGDAAVGAYTASMVAATVAYLALLRRHWRRDALALPYALFLAGAAAWLPLVYLALTTARGRETAFRWAALAALTLTSAGAVLLVRAVPERPGLAAYALLFQIVVLDNLVWGWRFVR